MHQQSVWTQLTQLPYLNLYTNLVNSAMELDVFSRLTEPTTTGTLAGKMDWNPSNTGYLLSALTSIGFVEKNGEFYRNTSETDRYLVKGSPEYLGGFLLFYGLNEGATPMDVKKLVTNGPQPVSQPQMDQSLDFAQYGAALRAAQAGYRQQELLRIVRALPENSGVRRVLDVGCATGLLGLAVVGDQLERTGVLFDQIPPNLIQESVEMAGLSHRIEVKNGNFLTDDLGQEYDLILAISVLLFAKGQMEPLMKKFYDALNSGGVLLVVTEGIAPDQTAPWDMVLGYMPYYLQGMDMGVLQGEVETAAQAAGFDHVETRTELLCSGTQDIIVLRK